MKCINHNSSEYKALNEVVSDKLLLDILINRWQEDNKSDEFPSVKELDQLVNKLDVKNNLAKGVISLKKEEEVNYMLKSVEILQSDKAKQVFAKGIKNNWPLDKILTELQVPKEQKQLILGLGITDREQIVLELANAYSYTVEINTAKAPLEGNFNNFWIFGNEYRTSSNMNGVIINYYENRDTPKEKLLTENEYTKLYNQAKQNTSHYSNLTVPGGTNYTENEIATPAITPSIKGHAQFATDDGIGWFRSDDKVDGTSLGLTPAQLANMPEEDIAQFTDNTKTRRILEVQSDLFQKGRDRKDLAGMPTNKVITAGLFENEEFSFELNDYVYDAVVEDIYYEEENQTEPTTVFYKNGMRISYEEMKIAKKEYEKQNIPQSQNQFLQLLNKDNNWVTFFVKSIIQDSAKKGYEKVLFPRLDTIIQIESQVRFKTYKEAEAYYKDENWQKEDDRLRKEYNILKEWKDGKYTNDKIDSLSYKDGIFLNYEERISKESFIELLNKKLISKKEEIASHQPSLLNTAKFYENDITNILNKQYGKENVKQVTDESGNTWNEVTIDQARDLKTIALRKEDAFTDKKTLNKVVLTKIAEGLKARLGVEFAFVSAEEAVVMLKDIKKKTYAKEDVPVGFYSNGVAIFVEDRLTDDVVWHEFGHAFVDAVYKDNPLLFNKLYKELESTQEGKDLINKIEATYKDELTKGTPNFKKEVVVTALGHLADGKFKSKESKGIVQYLQELLQEISNYLKGLLGKDIDVKTLQSRNLTLGDLAELMVSGKGKINIGYEVTKELALKAEESNFKQAKAAIGIKNPGYEYSDLQKNMLLKRLKLYNLKNSTRHSVDIEKIGQANLYKIKFNYVPQVNIGFKKRDTGDSNQSTNVNPEVEELFETNPELANAVYEALGFKSKPDVILPIGTSGSGKSTFIKSLPQENLVVIEPDAMRVEFTGDMNDKSKDKEIYIEAANRAIQAIKQGKQVVFDTTNLTKDKRLSFIEAIKKTIPNANIQYKLMELNPELAKQRIKAQLKKGENRAAVSDETIDRHAASYKQMLEDIKSEPISNFELTPQQKQQAQQLYSQYLDTLNKPNTNPILKDNQQEQVKKFAELQERLNNKEFLEGAKSAYASTPALQELGTQEEYNDYIARVSLGIIKNPSSGEYNYTSKVKDIVYHGTDKTFEQFSKKIEKITDREIPNTADAYFFTNDLNRIKDYGKNKVNTIINSKEPLNFKNISNDRARVLSNITYEKAKKYTDRSIDSVIADYDLYKDYIVFEPEQIHILGSKQDIQGFKEFVTQQSTNVKPTIDLSKEWSGDLKTRPVYTPEGVNTMRTESAKPNEHFGNPFSASGYSNTIKVPSVQTAVKAYKDWLLTGYATWLDENGNAEDFAGNQEQRKWILDQINQGKLDGATLLYAGKLAARGEGMHPTALVEVVDQLRSNQQSTDVKLTPDEIFTQDQLKTITEQLAYVVLSKVDTLEASTEVDYSIIDDLLESLNARAIDDEDLELSNRVSNVVDNLDMFKERVKTYIKDFGFTESEEDVEDEDGNIVPINVLNVSDLKDAPSRVKLLVALLPSQDRSNSYLGLPKMVNFQEAWNDLKYAIADLPATHPDGDVVDGLEAIEGKLYELSKYKPHFRILADKLISPNTSDQLRTQFYNTFTGTKINYSTTLINRQDGQMSVKIIDSDIQASDKLIRNEWNANFVDNIGIYDQMTLFHKPEEVKIVKDLANAFSVSIKKDIKSKTVSKESLSTFRQLLNKIGVTISTDALKSAIEAQNKESEALNLYSLMFDPKTGLYNGIKAIVDKSGQPFFTKNKTFRSEILNQDAFLELAKHEAKFRSDLGQSQILGPEGNAFGLFSKHNALTQILSDYKSNPEALKALENSSYTKNTRWGKWMLKDKANAKAFNVVVLNNYKQEFGGDKGTSPSELKPGDTLTNVVNRTLKGNYIGLAEADKNNQSTFVGPKPEESHVRGDLTYMYLENDNAVDILMDYLADEINRIADVHDQLFGENKIALDRQIQHYHYAKVPGDNKANGLKLYILPELDLNSFGLLYNSGKPMPLNSDNFYNNTALREYVREAFLTVVKQDVARLIEVGVLNSDFTNNSIDSAVVNKYSHPYKVFNTVGDFTLNSIIANVEQTKLFNCDPAMYKTDKLGNLFTDISKRVPALTAQGTSPMVYSDNLGNQVVKPTYTSAVIANIETPSKYFINDKGEVKPEIIDEIYKAINSDLNSPKVSKESIETSLKGYKKVNRTDAQAWITIDLYRQRLLSFGQWDMKVHEPIFEDIKAGRPITAEHMLLFAQPLKTVHVERKFQDGVFVLHYNKQSEAVLHPFLVKDLALNNLLTAMENSKTDHVITLDGKKVGASGIVKITDKEGNILPSDQIKLNNVTLSTRFVLLQQDLRRKGVKQTLVASQAPKVTFADVQLSENYIVDGEKLTGEEAVIALHNVTSELSDMGLSDLKQELQVNDDGSVSDAAFRAKLIKDLEDSDASDNIIEALKEGLPIDAIPGLRNTAQSKAMAMTRTAAVKLTQLGASLIQMSDFGFTGVAGTDVNTSIIWFKDPSTELLPTRLVKGKIRPSQVLIPYSLVSKIPGWKSMTPEQLKEAIDPECLRGFSYRIPNQGHSSNDVFEIVGILPESCGDVMIAYGEITKKTGSDFDIDKNYIMLPNVEFDKASGKLRKIKYNPNRSKNDPYYKAALENRRLDLMSGLLGDPKTYLSNVSPLDNPWLVDLCAELFPATSTNTNLDFFTGTYQANIKSLYDNAKSLVGVVANQLSDSGVAQLDNLLLNSNLGRGVIDRSNGINRLSPITGETGILISTILNAYANGILDAAKDPYITRANINQQTAPVAFMLIRAGVDPNWVVAFIGQPIIKRLIAEIAKSESSIYVKKRNKKGKIITPLDIVLNDDKLPEDRNYILSVDDLNNILKGKSNSRSDQLAVLSLFLKYQKIAKNLSASIRASKQDVNGGGKSLNYARALNNDLIKIINSGEIINLEKKIGVVVEDGEVVVEDGLPVMDKSRMVSTYHENSVNQSIIMFSNMFITQSPAFISTVNDVLTMQGIEFSTFNIDLIEKISNNVYSYLLSHPLSGISKQAYDNLFFGDNSIAVRIKNIKNSKGKLAANLLIENMKYDIAYTASDPSFVGLNNAKQLSKQSKDALYLAWKELAAADIKLAEDLVKYSYYSSGFSKTLTSFYEHIPISLLKSMDFTAFIKGITIDLYNDGYLHKAGSQIIKNLHGSTELVPTLPFVDPYGAFNTDYIFVLGKKLKDQYKISDVTETHAEHKRFVKFNNNLYKLAGYTTSGDNPVYVRTNKLGYSDKGNIIKEYFFDSNSNVSIIPDNNVSLPVEIAAVVGDPSKITPPTIVTKLKTIAIKPSTASLDEAEIERIAKEKQKEC